jgi:phage antirepressor YoqD-like protein
MLIKTKLSDAMTEANQSSKKDDETHNTTHSQIGQALVASAKLKAEDIERILTLQREKNILFGEAAKQLGLIKEGDLKKYFQNNMSMPIHTMQRSSIHR